MIVDLNELPKIRNKQKNKKIVLAIGTFDLFHFEHLNYLKDAKKLGDVLVVVIKDNYLAKFKKHTRPIIDESQRIEIIDSLRCVDHTILCDKNMFEQAKQKYNFCLDEQNNNWLFSFFEICEKLKPDILYHEDTTFLNPARNFVSQKFGIKLVERKRTARITTTKIIEKIKKL